MHDHFTYDYAIVRVVPKVEREEFVNVGVIVSCQQLDLLVARIELDEHDFGDGQPGSAGELSREQLRGERLRPLSRAAEFEHIHTVVVGFDDRGQRAAFAQRHDVASGGDGSHAAHYDRGSVRSAARSCFMAANCTAG